MMFSDELLRQLMATFVTEAQEHVQGINRHLLTLEQQPAVDVFERTLAEIFREAHSLKGAARAVNQGEIETLSHRLETLFGLLRSGARKPDPDLFDVVYHTLDALGALVEGIAGGSPAQVDVAGLAARLDAIAKGEPAKAPPPPPPMLPAAPAPLLATTPPPVAAPTTLPAPIPIASPAAPTETVRVATAKLDSLMTQVGELQVTRLGSEQRLGEVRSILARVEAWDARWREIRPLVMADFRSGVGAAPAPKSAAPIRRDQWDSEAIRRLLDYLEASEANLRAVTAQLRHLRQRLQADSRRMAQVADDLEEDVRRTRMLPIATVFDAFPRMVRDLARELGKDVRLVIQGGETEVDRSVIEQIKDPLTHLLRNAIDHGLEVPSVRVMASKPAEGAITLTAAQHGDSIAIEVNDDGAGIDLAQVRASAIDKGIVSAEEAAAISDREALWLIFRSGLSTAAEVSNLSGRGVGLDVVRESIERLHGTISVNSQPGQGTRFSLNLPLTVATTLCLLVRANNQTFAVPVSNVARTVRVKSDEVGHVEGRAAIRVDGRPLALMDLAQVLGADGRWRMSTYKAMGGQRLAIEPNMRSAVVLSSVGVQIAFLVDALVDVLDVVSKSLPQPLRRVRHIAGATILGNGEVVIILNVADLLREAGRVGVHRAPAMAVEQKGADDDTDQVTAHTILIADDSFTTRTLEKNILEMAGYRVRVAADGAEAWNMLQSEGCDLLVSDVMMPRLDGLELTARVRADERFKHLPVILVTAQDTNQDRERGIQVGADAYIVKSGFDQETLLATIRRLI